MTTDATHTATPGPEQLRASLAEEICRHGVIQAPRVEAAFRAVPRHLFLVGTDLQMPTPLGHLGPAELILLPVPARAR